MPDGTYSLLGPFNDKPYAVGERPTGSHIPMIPLMSGAAAWDSTEGYYPHKRRDSQMGFQPVRARTPRRTDHPSTKKAGLRHFRKAAAGPPVPKVKLPVAEILRKLRSSPTGTTSGPTTLPLKSPGPSPLYPKPYFGPAKPAAPVSADMENLVEATKASIPKPAPAPAAPAAPVKSPWQAYRERMQPPKNPLDGANVSGAMPPGAGNIGSALEKTVDAIKSPTGKKVLGGTAATAAGLGGLRALSGNKPAGPAAPVDAAPGKLTMADLPNFEPPALQEPAPPPTSPTVAGEPGKPGQIAQAIGKYGPYAGAAALGVGGLAYLMHRLSEARRRKQEQKLLPYVLKAAEDTHAFAQEHPLVAGFLQTCGEAGLDEQQIREKIARACFLDPVIEAEFEKCGMGSFNGMPGSEHFTRPAPAIPKPAAPPKPAPAGSLATPNDFRGKGEWGALDFTPTRAPYMKTPTQLDAEQGMDRSRPNDYRYGALESIVPGLTGAVGGTAGAIGNMGGALAQIGTKATDGMGLTNGWTEGVGDWRAMSQDVRDRGFHQMAFPMKSRAFNDWQAHTADNVQQHGGPIANKSVAVGNAVVNTSANTMPYVASMGKITPGKTLLSRPTIGPASLVGSLAAGAKPIAENVENEMIGYNASSARPMLGPDGKPQVAFGTNPRGYNFDDVSPQAAAQAGQGLRPEQFGGDIPQALKTPSQRITGGGDGGLSQPTRPDVSQVVNGEPTIPGEPQTNIGPLQGGDGIGGGGGDDPNAPQPAPAPGGNDLTTALDEAGQPITTPQQMQKLVGSAEKYLQQKVGDPETQRAMEQFMSDAADGNVNPQLQEMVTQKLQEAGLDPQSAGQAAGNMDFGSQLAMWLGLGLGTIGIINALTDSEGGIGDWLMGLLGLGIGGGLAAHQGYLGQDAQKMTQDAVGQAGDMFSGLFGGGGGSSGGSGGQPAGPPAPPLSPADQAQTAGLGEKFPWLRNFTGGGTDPNGLDAGDAPALMSAWHGGKIDDNQVQQLAQSLPPGLKRQVSEGVTKQQQSWDPRNYAIGGKLRQLQGFLQ